MTRRTRIVLATVFAAAVLALPTVYILVAGVSL